METCESCNFDNPSDFKFCMNCGWENKSNNQLQNKISEKILYPKNETVRPKFFYDWTSWLKLFLLFQVVNITALFILAYFFIFYNIELSIIFFIFFFSYLYLTYKVANFSNKPRKIIIAIHILFFIYVIFYNFIILLFIFELLPFYTIAGDQNTINKFYNNPITKKQTAIDKYLYEIASTRGK